MVTRLGNYNLFVDRMLQSRSIVSNLAVIFFFYLVTDFIQNLPKIFQWNFTYRMENISVQFFLIFTRFLICINKIIRPFQVSGILQNALFLTKGATVIYCFVIW